jgi:HK97 family phage prohead protease
MVKNYLDFSIKSAADSGSFTAIASTSDLDRDGERILPKAFLPLPAAVPVHWNHDFDKVIGTAKPYLKGDQLWVDGQFARTELAQTIRSLVMDNHVRTMSIAFRAEPNGGWTKGTDGVRTLVKGELLAADIVSIPSNRGAMLVSARSYTPPRLSHAMAQARAAIALSEATLMLTDTRPAWRRDLDDLLRSIG